LSSFKNSQCIFYIGEKYKALRRWRKKAFYLPCLVGLCYTSDLVYGHLNSSRILPQSVLHLKRLTIFPLQFYFTASCFLLMKILNSITNQSINITTYTINTE
jgi:hypothetical protein